jgi:DNA invertase Pin-like site-specific DNA recombinase
MKYGYARVSTDGQTLDAQIDALEAAGSEKIFRETASGAKSDRPELRKVIGKLKAGDTLVVTRLDRLARSTRDLLNVIAEIDQAGATFRSLADTWADTTTPHGRLLITVLGGLAEFERSLILSRTSEGARRAKERGVKFGPKEKLTGTQRRYVIEQKAAGTPVREIARIVGVSPATVSRVKTD